MADTAYDDEQPRYRDEDRPRSLSPAARGAAAPRGEENGNGNGYGGDDRRDDREPRDGGRGGYEQDRGRNDQPGDQNPGNNLHISGLAPSVETKDLEEAFGRAGAVQKASIMYDPRSRESRGFGFVLMATSDDAKAAIEQLDGYELKGKAITVAVARRTRPRTPTPGMYKGPARPDRYGERQYQPRSYDSRYADRRYDDRRGGDRYGRDDRYDDRRGDRYDDRRYDDRGARDPRDDRAPRGYDSREPRGGRESRYDDRRGEDRYAAGRY